MLLQPLVGVSPLSVRNSYEFVDFLNENSCRHNDVMISCDVTSLFTKVPVDLALNVVRELLTKDSSLNERSLLSCDEIVQLLEFCLKSTSFVFRGEIYAQNFGCSMGSPISTIVANLVMEHIERVIFSQSSFDVLFWKRFVDDTWIVINKDDVRNFFAHINNIEPSIKFTMEMENDLQTISFLDVSIRRENDRTFSSQVHRKPTHTDRYLDFHSHHPMTHKRSVARALYHRATRICSRPHDTQEEVKWLEHVLRINNFPPFVLSQVKTKSTLMRQFPEKQASKLILPYIRGCSERIARILKQFDIFTVYKPVKKLSSVFRLPKDPISEELVSGVVYKIPCNDCEQVYIGQTGNSLATRVKQHKAACVHFQPQKSALAEHSLTASHQINWSGACVLSRETRWRQRLFLEAVHTNLQEGLTLNRCEPSSADQYCNYLR